MSKNNQFTIDKVQTIGYYLPKSTEEPMVTRMKKIVPLLDNIYRPDVNKSKFLI